MKLYCFLSSAFLAFQQGFPRGSSSVLVSGLDLGPIVCRSAPSTFLSDNGNPAPKVESYINIPTACTISDVRVEVNIDHQDADDLEVRIFSPQGTLVYAWDNNCNSLGSQPDLHVTFDDASTNTGCGTSSRTGGVAYQPNVPLSTFDGQQAMGQWTLDVRDTNSGIYSGDFDYWCLYLTCSAGPSSITACQTPKEIREGYPDVVTPSIDIGSCPYVADVNVYVDLDHENVGEIDISLTGPSGDSVEILAQNTCSNQDDLKVYIDDDIGMSSPCQDSERFWTPSPGQQLDATFENTDGNGSWNLTIDDNVASGNTGEFNQWCLQVTCYEYECDRYDDIRQEIAALEAVAAQDSDQCEPSSAPSTAPSSNPSAQPSSFPSASPSEQDACTLYDQWQQEIADLESKSATVSDQCEPSSAPSTFPSSAPTETEEFEDCDDPCDDGDGVVVCVSKYSPKKEETVYKEKCEKKSALSEKYAFVGCGCCADNGISINESKKVEECEILEYGRGLRHHSAQHE